MEEIPEYINTLSYLFVVVYMLSVPENVAVKVLNRAHSFTAEVEIPRAVPKACSSPME